MEYHENKFEIAHCFRRRDTDSHNRLSDHSGPRDSLNHRVAAATAVAPHPDPEHPLYGLYRFKSGFGGTMPPRQGTWDYPYDQNAYEVYCARESASSGFHL